VSLITDEEKDLIEQLYRQDYRRDKIRFIIRQLNPSSRVSHSDMRREFSSLGRNPYAVDARLSTRAAVLGFYGGRANANSRMTGYILAHMSVNDKRYKGYLREIHELYPEKFEEETFEEESEEKTSRLRA